MKRYTSIDPYGVYYLEILEKTASKVMVTNHPELGKNQAIQKLISPLPIDAEHLYPAIRGRDIKRWGFNSKFWVLIPNLSTRKQDWLAERHMRPNFPDTFNYLNTFRDQLLSRESYWQFFSKTVLSKEKIEDIDNLHFRLIKSESTGVTHTFNLMLHFTIFLTLVIILLLKQRLHA